MIESPLKKIELSPSIAIVIAGLMIAAAIIFVNRFPASPAAAQLADTKDAAGVPAPTQSEHIIGSANAPIVLIEYSDFQCPYCSMIYPSLKKIVSESNGTIAWVMRDMPLIEIHPQALPAAHAAACITEQLGNDGWWKYVDAVFNNQQSLTPAYSALLATEFGADPQKFKDCVASGKFQKKIDQESTDAQLSGAQGTPFTIVYNSATKKQYAIPGALPYNQIMAVITRAQNSQ